jgi:hypothetical protein
MADQSKLEQMLEKLVNNDRDGAESLFHEFVIEKSRGIYEKMLENDLQDLEVDEASHKKDDDKKDDKDEDKKDESVDEANDEEVDEASDDEEVKEESDEDVEEATDEKTDENFGEITPEADPMGGDAADDMMQDMEDDGEEGDMDKGDDEEIEDRVVDLEDALDDLKAEFEKMMSDKGDDEGGEDDDAADMDMDMGDEEKEDEAIEPASELAGEELPLDGVPSFEGKKSEGEVMREYVNKVSHKQGEDHKAKSPVAGKNDMGGNAGNIAAGGEGDTKGSGTTPKEDSAGNVNVPGG